MRFIKALPPSSLRNSSAVRPPALIEMTVEATDSSGQSTALPYAFFIEIPTDTWGEAVRLASTRKQRVYEEFGAEAREAYDAEQAQDASVRTAPFRIAGLCLAGLGTIGLMLFFSHQRHQRKLEAQGAFSIDAEEDTDGPTGLGGPLALLGVGLALAPISLIFTMVGVHLPLVMGDAWEALTTPGTQAHDPLWKPLIVSEILANVLFLAASLALVVLFSRKQRWFPRGFIVYRAVYTSVMVLDIAAVASIMPAEVFTPQAVGALAGAVLWTLVWVPYMLFSARVRNTFVN